VSAVIDTASASLLSVRHHGDDVTDRRAPADHVTRKQLFVAGAAVTSLDGGRTDGGGGSDVTEPFVFVFVAGC